MGIDEDRARCLKHLGEIGVRSPAGILEEFGVERTAAGIAAAEVAESRRGDPIIDRAGWYVSFIMRGVAPPEPSDEVKNRYELEYKIHYNWIYNRLTIDEKFPAEIVVNYLRKFPPSTVDRRYSQALKYGGASVLNEGSRERVEIIDWYIRNGLRQEDALALMSPEIAKVIAKRIGVEYTPPNENVVTGGVFIDAFADLSEKGA